MADTTFSNGTLIQADWMNDVNDNIYGPTAPAGTLRAQLLANTGASMVGAQNTDCVYTTVAELYRRKRSVADWLSDAQRADGEADGVSIDCSAAVQSAIDWCLTNKYDLTVPYRLRINSSVNIDRLVNTGLEEFSIIGENSRAGFYTSSNVTIFESTLTTTSDPQSEFVTFRNIRFETSASANLSYVLSHKFLRVKFLNCMFQRIRCITSSIYIQTIHFDTCNIRNLTGYFITCAGLYDVDFNLCIVENCGRIVHCVDPTSTKGALGLRVRGGVWEGLSDTMLNIRGAQSLVVRDVHMEANFSPWINVNDVGTMTNSTITIAGNVCVCSSSSDVVVYYGTTSKVISEGNTIFTGRLHDNTVQIEDLVSIGDKALSGGSIHDTVTNHYSTINGVTRVGTANKAWSDSDNHINKDTSGNFALGGATQSSAKLLVFGADQTSSNYAQRWFDSAGNEILSLRNDRMVMFGALQNAVNDAAASALGVPVGGAYRNGSVLMYRVS